MEFVVSKLQGKYLENMSEKWDEYDINHDGVMDRDEFAKMWAAVERPAGIHKPSADELFGVVDVDLSSNISFDECAIYYEILTDINTYGSLMHKY